MARNAVSVRLQEVIGAAVEVGLAEAGAPRAEPYYDEAADRDARELYYADLGASDGEPLRAELAHLFERTHDPRTAYKPMQWVYPWADLHPDGLLRSIHSGATFSAEELIQANAEIERARSARTSRCATTTITTRIPGRR